MLSSLPNLFQVVLEASWQSTLIILLILVVRPLMGSRVPARWRYLLWSLVLVRLLIPAFVFPPNPVSMQNIAVVQRPMEQLEIARENSIQPESFLQPQSPEVYESPSLLPAPSKPGPVPWVFLASVGWLTGVLLAIGFMAGAHLLLWRRLSRTDELVNVEVLELWEKCCDRLHIIKRPRLRFSVETASPALVGFFRPILLLSEKNIAAFSREDWENVFVHELAHYQRGDHWINACQLLALGVHWFNPMIWIGFRQLRADRELAADEWALRHLERDNPGSYGATLLKVLSQSCGEKLSTSSVGILEDRVQLKRRLERIVSFAPRTFIGSLFGLGIVIVVAVLVLGRQTEKVDLSKYDESKPEDIFVDAARAGDIPAMRQLLRQGVDVNAVSDVDGNKTALITAASENQLAAMRFLISKGADVNRKADETAIQVALQQGRPECAQYLLDHGAVCDPAMIATWKGDLPGLQPVLSREPPNIDLLKRLCRVAGANDQAEILRTLVEKIRTEPGEAQWHLGDGDVLVAIAHGNRDVVQAVLDESPYLQKLNQGGVLRLGAAVEQNPGMRDWLISKGFIIPKYTDGEKLIDATERGDIAEMDRLLKAGVDVNYRGESSWTPITKAAAWNKVRSVKFLLAHGADPNSVHLPGWDYTPLCLTAKPEIADMVLAAGGNINATLFKRGVHIIDYCITFGPTEMVKWFLAHGVDPTKVGTDSPEQTFLFDAANPEIAELLIQHGVDPKAKTKNGTTALSWICMFGREPAETARVLLKHGADPNAADNDGITPLMRARDGATVDVLMEYGANIHAKTKEGLGVLDINGNMADTSRLEALIRHGASFDLKANGPTMLVRAAWSGQVDILSFLLNHGVDPNIEGCWNKRANDYMAPLTAAVTDGQYDAAELLVEHGAKIQEPSQKGKKGVNMMDDALGNRRTRIVKLFWDHGDRSISELTYDISQGRPIDEVKKLLDNGTPADPPQNSIFTPLTLAAEMGDLDIVKLLVQHGANINPKPDKSPIEAASWEGQDEIVAFLLQHGAKVDYQALWGAVWNCNPYPDQRSKMHFEETVKLLIDAGGLKGLSESQSAKLLVASIFSRYPGGNTSVVKMLIDSGLSLNAHYENGRTVIQLVRDACKENTCSTPTKQMLAFLEPLEKPGNILR